ncbi:MAG TPA: PQQ-dependent sugar dehydrogenase [Thermoanaerobaculia bacterium]
MGDRWMTLSGWVPSFLTVALMLTGLVPAATAEMLPGFRLEAVAQVPGFVTSVVTDSKGTIYFTTTDGQIFRVEGEDTVVVATLPTRSLGNGGLLGMAMKDDRTAVVHYTLWDDREGHQDRVLDDVISHVDLVTGEESLVHAFICDVDVRERGADSEHHGGNPIVAPDGSIFVGIGDYGSGRELAQQNGWNAGRIWRIDPDGNATEWARGMRNPYDLAWDPVLERVVVADNGPFKGDEIHILAEGDNGGWPRTFGDEPPMEGASAPVYVFPMTVAPTGMLRLNGTNERIRDGYLLGGFVTDALYYFPDLTADPVEVPVAIIDDFGAFIMDVTQTPTGELYLATVGGWAVSITTIHRLHAPARGDCNGDGKVNVDDLAALSLELADGAGQSVLSAHLGANPGSWGCDVNGDGVITQADVTALSMMLTGKKRSVRR